jgi:hypothetical protein
MITNLQVTGWKAALRGMRNPLQSHDKADSTFNPLVIGHEDIRLMKKLVSAGHSSHRKFLRMINITCDIEACLKFWDEFDTYEFKVSNSTSQMHTLGKRLLTKDDFHWISDVSLDEVNFRIQCYKDDPNKLRWRQMIDSIPQSFLYTRTVQFNYETFMNMYVTRKNHKMEEWVEFCEVIRENAECMDIILRWRGL